jgi:microcystin-dependent protein
LTLELGQMPRHAHDATALISVAAKPGTSESPANGIPAIPMGEDGSTRLSAYAPVSAANVALAPKATKVTVQPAGDGQPLPLLNPFLGTRFVIAMQGAYPSGT